LERSRGIQGGAIFNPLIWAGPFPFLMGKNLENPWGQAHKRTKNFGRERIPENPNFGPEGNSIIIYSPPQSGLRPWINFSLRPSFHKREILGGIHTQNAGGGKQRSRGRIFTNSGKKKLACWVLGDTKEERG